MVKEVIERLKIIQNRISENLPQSIRPYCRGIKPESRGILFAGPRGVGKTTYILQSIKDRPYFYLSADNPLVGTVTLYDLVEAIFLQGYEGVVIDEIHFGHNWSAHLKALYDSFPGKILWASDSSSVFLRSGISDLSRRFKIIALPLLSLREFIALNEGLDFDPLDPFSVSAAGAAKIVSKVNVLRIFQNYIRYGFRPIYLEGPADYADKVMNTVYKTMQMDIPFLIPRLTENHLRLMHAIVGYLGMSVIPQLNISNLTAEWALSKEKLYQLLEALNTSNIIRIIRKKTDNSVHSKGAKLFLYEPSLYTSIYDNKGNLRESFTVCAFREMGKQVWAASQERDGDFIIDNCVIEVGGKKKKPKKSDFIICDDLDLPLENKIPLWLLGFGW